MNKGGNHAPRKQTVPKRELSRLAQKATLENSFRSTGLQLGRPPLFRYYSKLAIRTFKRPRVIDHISNFTGRLVHRLVRAVAGGKSVRRK